MVFGPAKNEIELLKASLRGKPQAFGELVGRYQSVVCAITYSATGSVERSEDLAQETFLKAWKNLKQLKDLSKFRPWLCRIARSTTQNWFRSQGRAGARGTVSLEAAGERPSEEIGPVESAMSGEQQALVRKTLARIPQNLREPLVLFYREQQSTREVAIQLGLSENAARQRISRGRAMLREQVAHVVESTIAQTQPGKAFKTAVIAAIAGAAAKSGTATAATSFIGLGGKIALTAASIVVVTGAVWVVRRQAAPADGRSSTSETVEPVVPASPASEGTVGSADAGAPVSSQAVSSAAPAPARGGGESEGSRRSETVGARQARRAGPPSVATAPYEFKPRGVLSGLVTDAETGEPVVKARVRLSGSGLRSTQTDGNGFYSIAAVPQPGNYTVGVDALTHVSLRQDREGRVVHLSDEKQVVQHYQLAKACMLDVWVVDQNGVGIAGARVSASSPGETDGGAPSSFANGRPTDPNGYVLLGGIPAGDMVYMISAWYTVDAGREELASGWTTRRQEYGYAPGKAAMQLPDPNVIGQVTIVLEDGQDVPGYVEYSGGVPAADVQLIARPAWLRSDRSLVGPVTADDGSVTFQHITPGIYQISWFVATTEGEGSSRSVTQVQLPPPDGGPLTIRLPEPSPQGLASIRGTITFLGSTPTERVLVRAVSGAGTPVFGTVSQLPDGTAEFVVERLVPGQYTLRFAGTDMEDKSVRSVTAPTSDLVVEMAYAPKPKLTGAVLDAASGEPIRRFEARVRKLRTLRGSPYTLQNRWVRFEDEQGGFRVETVGPGIYDVQVRAEGYAPWWSDEVNTDENEGVTISLSRGGAIRGRVVNEDGEVITGAKVTPLSTASGVMPRTKTDFVSEEGAVQTAGGAFVLDHLPAGTETLRVTHPDYLFNIVEGIVVREGQTTAGVEIVLTEGATVEGYVYDAAGRPQAGATLLFNNARGYGESAYEDVWRLASGVTDSNGFYRVVHLPEEVCYVRRPNAYQALGVVCRAVVPRVDAVTRLDFGGTPVVGGIAILRGQPLAKTKLELLPADETEAHMFTSYAMTNEHGAFVLGGLAPGEYSVYYRHTRPTSVSGKYSFSYKSGERLRLTTVRVGESDMDLGVIPADASTLSVTVDGLRGDAMNKIERVFLRDPGGGWLRAVRVAEAVAGADGLWKAYDVEPGRYTVVVERADGIQYRRDVTLEVGSGPWESAVAVPQGTARVTGRIGGSKGTLTFWREGKDIFGRLRPDSDGRFTVENLPGGTYAVGPVVGLSYDVPALAEFTLNAGEHGAVDLDAVTSRSEMAFAIVQVIDDSGKIHRDAGVWLEGPAGRIESVHFDARGHNFVATSGPHTVHVDVPGYRRIEKDVDLVANPLSANATRRVRILLERL